jgi:hypothetical protein
MRGLPSVDGYRKRLPATSRVPVGRSPGEARTRSAERMMPVFESDDLGSSDFVCGRS